MDIQIIYTSKYGCTADCATKLAGLLPGAALFDLAERQPGIGHADVVILGAPVYAGMIPKAMKQFVVQSRQSLLSKPLGLFICCSSPAEEAGKLLMNNFGEDLVEHAAQAVSFGGRLQRDKIKFMDKTILKMVAKSQPQRPEPAIDEHEIVEFASYFKQINIP